jgi:hypothetical protein
MLRVRSLRIIMVGAVLATTQGCSPKLEAERVAKLDPAKERTLVLAVLSVQSSYRENTEKPAGRVPDTVQWWISAEATWRIKTFAMDHDIHIHQIPSTFGPDQAISNTRKHYGDVIHSLHVLRFPDYTNERSVREVLKSADLATNLEVAPQGFAFWNPDHAKYRTQSQPKER